MIISAIAAKIEKDQIKILKAGSPSDVQNVIAKEVFANKAAKVYQIATSPRPIRETLANQELLKLTENPNKISNIIAEAKKEINFPDKSKIVVENASNINPQGLDPSVIPAGNYCYSGTRERLRHEPSHTPEGMPIRYLKMCPYMSSRTFNGVTISWCNFLNQGSLNGSLGRGQTQEDAEAEHQKLIEHFGSEEKLDEAAPLFLLWDSCKECGINEEDK